MMETYLLKFTKTLFAKTLQVTAFGALVGLAACSEPKETQVQAPQSDAASSATGDAAVSPSDASTDDPSEKLSAYIECYNGIDTSARGAYDRYSSWVDMDAGPDANGLVYGVYELSEYSVKDCLEEAQQAVNLEPKLPELDQAASNYIATIQPLNDILTKADQYYTRENYKDDDFAEGRAMHPTLVTAFDKYLAASAAFDAELSAFNKEFQVKRLAEIEATEGRNFAYWSLDTTIKAEVLAKTISQESFDMETANQLLADYEASATELIDYMKSDAEDLPATTTRAESSVEEFLIASKERIRRVRDNTPYTTADMNMINAGSGWMIDGTPDKVVRNYNEFIDVFNHL